MSNPLDVLEFRAGLRRLTGDSLPSRRIEREYSDAYATASRASQLRCSEMLREDLTNLTADAGKDKQ